MLPQHNRLKQSREFSQVYHYGKKAASDHLVMRVLFNNQSAQPQAGLFQHGDIAASPAQIGITVSQKVSKRAVIRNRLKRQIRAAMRTLLPHLKPNTWIVINLRPSAAQCEYGEFLRELEELLTKLEVIHGHS